MTTDEQNQQAAEFAVAIHNLIIERSPKSGDRALVDEVLWLLALQNVGALLIANAPADQQKTLYVKLRHEPRKKDSSDRGRPVVPET
jgi:hypothetical protein